jgi:CubicO group peptidase (beta-lactamase class C family)
MDFSKLREFQDYLASWRIPGNDCSVYMDGVEVYRHMAGYSDVERRLKICGSELYFFWSASKMITTSLALRLFEEGRFKMNDPLSEYIPEFRDMSVRVNTRVKEETVPATRSIEIRHLLNMTAGLDYNFNTPHINALRKSTNNKCTAIDIAREIAKSPLAYEPGTHWNYSLCHDVLGALIEVLTGKRLRDYAREVLFDPLGMTDTSYNLPSESKMQRMAHQYIWRDDLGKYIPTQKTCNHILGSEYDSGGAGIISTCDDFITFASCIACGGTAKNGYRYLSPETVELWRTNTLTPEQIGHISNKFPQLSGYGYGLGVRTMLYPDACGSLSPTGEFGWDGAGGVTVIIDTDRKLALVYTQHMLESQQEYFFPKLRDALYASI